MTNIQLQQKPQHIAKPLIKWAGGKTQLLPQILERLPETVSIITRNYAIKI